ncbi:MAG: hypothetical protein Q9165_004386 [Trypethelium subeluteriae]
MEEDFYLIEQLINLMPSAKIKKFNDETTSALITAFIRAKNNPVWTRILRVLCNHYTIAELETETLNHGSYLHIAVTADSVIGVQVLLEKGVNPNQRTFGPHQLTPIHMCIARSGSVEICKLLVEFGADMSLKEKKNMETPLTFLINKTRPGNFKLFDHFLEADFPETIYTELLHETSYRFWAPRVEYAESQELFRRLLTTPKVAKHVNGADAEGITLLQKSAYQACLEAVELLLEAGADVTIGIPYEKGLIYPLQIACVRSRLDFEDPDEAPDADDSTSMGKELFRTVEICHRLLEQHHAKLHDPFKGITQLHVASYVGATSSIQQLEREPGATDRRGQWPSLEGAFTPAHLALQAFEVDLRVLRELAPKLGKKRLSTHATVSGRPAE